MIISDFTEKLKEIIVNNNAERNSKKEKKHFYCSDAFKCKRQVFYSLKHGRPFEENSAESVLRMDAGVAIEEAIVAHLDKAGVLLATQGRIDIPISYGIDLHGNYDAEIILNGKRHILEIKSFYGFQAAADYIAGKPKEAHLGQLAQYMHFKFISNGILLYIDRADCSIYSFDVSLIDGVIIYRKTGTEEWQRFTTIKEIISSYHVVAAALKLDGLNGEIPAPDYQYKYRGSDYINRVEGFTKTKIESELSRVRPISQKREPTETSYKIIGYEYNGNIYDNKDLAIEAYNEEIAKGIMPQPSPPVIGDWECKYCDYKTYCCESLGISLGHTPEELREFTDILEEIKSRKFPSKKKKTGSKQ